MSVLEKKNKQILWEQDKRRCAGKKACGDLIAVVWCETIHGEPTMTKLNRLYRWKAYKNGRNRCKFNADIHLMYVPNGILPNGWTVIEWHSNANLYSWNFFDDEHCGFCPPPSVRVFVRFGGEKNLKKKNRVGKCIRTFSNVNNNGRRTELRRRRRRQVAPVDGGGITMHIPVVFPNSSNQ